MPLLGSLPQQAATSSRQDGEEAHQPPMGHDSSPHRWSLVPTNSASSHRQNPVGSLPGAAASRTWPGTGSGGATRGCSWIKHNPGPVSCLVLSQRDVPRPRPAQDPDNRQCWLTPTSACQTLPVLSAARASGICQPAELWVSPTFLLAFQSLLRILTMNGRT